MTTGISMAARATVAAGVAILLVPGVVLAREVSVPDAQTTTTISASDGDVVKSESGVSAEVPSEIGGTISGHFQFEDGSASISVTRIDDRSAEVRTSSSRAAINTEPSTTESPKTGKKKAPVRHGTSFGRAISNLNHCTANYYDYDPLGKWTSNYTFYVSTNGKPGSLYGPAYGDEAVESVLNWHQVNNVCGIGDSMARVSSYGGLGGSLLPTLVNSNITACVTTRDYTNTIGWRAGVSGAVAGTCNYAVGGSFQESDIALNSNKNWVNYPSSCPAGYYYTEDVITHEMGHWLGLEDLYAGAAEAMTMYHTSPTCSMMNPTLAFGDANAINALY